VVDARRGCHVHGELVYNQSYQWTARQWRRSVFRRMRNV
jgi:hypothetical protein